MEQLATPFSKNDEIVRVFESLGNDGRSFVVTFKNGYQVSAASNARTGFKFELAIFDENTKFCTEFFEQEDLDADPNKIGFIVGFLSLERLDYYVQMVANHKAA